jgi:BNR repeat-like domain
MVMAGTSLGDPGQCRLEPADGDPARLEAHLPSPCVQKHARVPAENGGLARVWFGGTQEGPPDISICGARLRRGASGWSAPVRLSDDRGPLQQKPILFPAPDGKLWSLWAAQVSGNQDPASVRYRVSNDGGLSWGPIGTSSTGPAPSCGIRSSSWTAGSGCSTSFMPQPARHQVDRRSRHQRSQDLR